MSSPARTLRLYPGNSYKFAMAVTEQLDPTDPTVTPASGLTAVEIFFADAPLVDDPLNIPPLLDLDAIITAKAFLRTPMVENGTYTEDGVIYGKYVGTVLGADNFIPFSERQGKQVYIYQRQGTDLLRPEIALIMAVSTTRIRLG